MADECDQAQVIEELNLSQALKHAGAGHFKLPQGTSGECTECGESSSRLVSGHCAPCREQFAKDASLRDQQQS